MPELPEVETIVRSLRNGGGMTGESILNRQIRSVDCFNPKTLVFDGTAEQCSEVLVGCHMLSVERRAKYIHIRTEKPAVLIHLRMSGDLRCEGDVPDKPLLPHDRFVFHFTDGMRLVFNDVRKFGRIWVTDDPDTVLAGLGVEPLGADFTAGWFAERLKGVRRMIKTVLLDQSIIAGIGNIYADESLFDAGILPTRPADSLSKEECEKLCASIKKTLAHAIEQNGSSFDWAYKGGHFQNEFRVYQRKGEPCPICGTPIERIVVSQRGTHYCPHCQE